MLSRVTVGVVLVAALSGGAFAKTKGPTLRDRQQAACYGDVKRLCGDAMPDEAKVTACMEPKKALVSEGCRALWDVTD